MLAILDTTSAGSGMVVGGSFAVGDAVPAENIAAFDGTAWSGLGAGTNGTLRTLLVQELGGNAVLFAGGDFSTARGVAATHIARWDEVAWTALGSCVSGSVHDLAIYNDGEGPALYVGGTAFVTAVGSSTSQIARWDGTSWSNVGAGVIGTSGAAVNAIAGHDDGTGPALFAGGSFALAGGRGSSGIAKWGRSPPTIRLIQPGGPGSDTEIRDHHLVIGQEYYNLFSTELCAGGPGNGPYLGLCFPDVGPLMQQILSPVGAIPLHFVATGRSARFGPYAVPPGITVDALAVAILPSGGIFAASPVRFTVN